MLTGMSTAKYNARLNTIATVARWYLLSTPDRTTKFPEVRKDH